MEICPLVGPLEDFNEAHPLSKAPCFHPGMQGAYLSTDLSYYVGLASKALFCLNPCLGNSDAHTAGISRQSHQKGSSQIPMYSGQRDDCSSRNPPATSMVFSSLFGSQAYLLARKPLVSGHILLQNQWSLHAFLFRKQAVPHDGAVIPSLNKSKQKYLRMV
jgi:hypothetical protein